MSKHTPGPWRVGTFCWSIVSDFPVHANAIHGSDDTEYYGGYLIAESVATQNVSLIAAAPELLEALEEMTELASGPVGGVTVQMKRDALAKARRAIAKARGEA